MADKVSWRDWSCGLHNDHLTMRQVLETLPGNDSTEIHWLIRLLERPSSPLALSGAIDLDRHDCVHVLLGRGLLAQDEAFVLGFTMGADRKMKFWEPALFRFCAQYLYPKIYRLKARQIAIFNLGLEFARGSDCRDLHKFDFQQYLDQPVGKLRAMLKISTHKLAEAYRQEQQMIPDSKESKRLDIAFAN
ncbi:MAG: hypothetical protein EYC62_01835 [Alphaproteobacteria bacterium]|nr:MAG: hypothetical protein EYC62_01835 [Alphaproteobacteria bacterium]